MNIQIIVLIIDLAIALTVNLAALRKPRTPAGLSLGLLALFVAVWSLCDLLVQQSPLPALLPSLAATIYLVSMLAASAQFTYVVWQSNREHWIRRLPLGLLAILP